MSALKCSTMSSSGPIKKIYSENALQETMPQEAMTIKSCSNLKLNLKGFHEDNRKFTKEIATYGFFAAYNFASSNEKHRHFPVAVEGMERVCIFICAVLLGFTRAAIPCGGWTHAKGQSSLCIVNQDGTRSFAFFVAGLGDDAVGLLLRAKS